MTTELLHVEVLDAIGGDIVSGTHPSGSVLTLEQLQVRYGASRGIVRECMRVLETMGMLVSRRRVGLVVQDPSLWAVFDSRIIRWRLAGPGRHRQLATLTELRLGVEPVAARLAALRASDDERDDLRAATAMIGAYVDADGEERHLEADVRFHTLLLRASKNDMYASLADVIAETLSSRRRQRPVSADDRRQAFALHELVMRAVIARDGDAAELAMHDLLTEVRSAIEAPAPDGQVVVDSTPLAGGGR
ncbi:FCD domain-containing protein [Agrococcus versicolor]|uniref:FCD domain-containing protein n=1 Tax=Agrococcus versicolor TaxID=501482 RepID=A0ABP5MAM2_9MICO